MKKSFLVLLAIICIICFSCQTDGNNASNNSNQKEVDYPTVAQKICDCVSPLAELNKEIEFMVKADRKDEAMELLKEVKKQNDQTESCIDSLEKEYPGTSIIESKKISSLLEKKCPKTSAFLNNM